MFTTKGRRSLRATVLAAVAAVLMTTTAGVASGETVRVFDKVGDGVRYTGDPQRSRKADVQRFRVDHKHRKVRFRLYNAKGGTFGDFTDVWVDTDPRNPGPERLITFVAETGTFGVSKVDRFFNANNPKAGGHGPGTCGNDYPVRRYRVIDAGIPRACFGYPKRLRVSVQTAHDGFEVRRDWAPGIRRFSRWVGRG